MGANSIVDLISNFDTTVLLVYDLFHAELMVYALLVLSVLLPFLVKIVVVYFLITSFALVFLTDQLYSRWFTRVVLSLIVINIITGGTITSIFVANTPVSQLRTTRIASIIMMKNPGKGSTSADIDAFGSAPFETYAYFGADQPVAFEIGSNLASASTTSAQLNTFQMTLYQLTYDNAVGRDDLDFVNAWGLLNERLTKFPVLGSGLLYISNSIMSLAYSAASLQEVNMIAKEVGQNGNLNFGSINTDSRYEAFAASIESSLASSWKQHTPMFYAAAAMSSAAADSDVYLNTVRTAPFGIRQVAGYNTSRMLEPSYAMDSRIANSDHVLELANSAVGHSGTSSTTNTNTKYRGEFRSAVENNGYTSSVPPELYVQSQMEKYYSECATPSDSSEAAVDFGNSSATSMLHPCNVVVSSAQSNPYTSGRYASSNASSGNSSGTSTANALWDLADNLFGLNSIGTQILGFSVSDMFGAYESFGNGFSNENNISCKTDLYTLEDLDREYSRWLTDYSDSPQIQNKKECLETAHNMIRVMRQTRDEVSSSNRNYETFIYAVNAYAFQTHGSYAMDLGTYLAKIDTNKLHGAKNNYFASRNHLPAETREFFASFLPESSTTAGGMPSSQMYATELSDGNLAGLASNLRSLLLPFRDGYSIPATVTVRTPTAVASETQARTDSAGTSENSPLVAEHGLSENGAKVASAGLLGGLFAGTTKAVTSFMKGAFEKIAGSFSKILKIAKGALKIFGKVIQAVLVGLPILMVLGTYIMMYFVTIFSASLGMVFHTLWAIFLTGRLFNGPGSGDEQYGGVSLFPVVQFLMVPCIIGSELCAVTAGSGVTLDFFNQIVSAFGGLLGALGMMVGTAVFNDLSSIFGMSAIQFGDPLSAITSLLKPLGLLVGLTMLPMFMQRLMSYQPYQAAMSPASGMLQSSMSGMQAGATTAFSKAPEPATASNASGSANSSSAQTAGAATTASESIDDKVVQAAGK